MTGTRYSVMVCTLMGLLSFSLLLGAGCNKSSDSGETAQSGAPGGPPSGGMRGGGPGGPGGPNGGGPLAANASGSDIVAKKCGCHGPGGKGGRAPALTGGAGKSDDELFKIIHDGKGRMPAFASQLTDDQIKTVITELKSLQ